MTVKVFKTFVSTEGSPDIFEMDTIEHEGKKWLVPEWLEAPTLGWKKPARIICLDKLAYQKAPEGFGARFVLNNPIPKAVLNGEIPIQLISLYLVIERPEIYVLIPKGVH
jgi:hypothetical protein